jgi:hypothetical protein
MSVEDFATCLSGRLGTDVADLKKLTDDEWGALLGWWNDLDPATVAVLTWFATLYRERFIAAVEAVLAALGVTAIEVLGSLVAGVAFAMLVDSARTCQGWLAS